MVQQIPKLFKYKKRVELLNTTPHNTLNSIKSTNTLIIIQITFLHTFRRHRHHIIINITRFTE